MTTFISLATSATMFPAVEFGGNIITSVLTPEMVQRRLSHPDLIVSALNNDHKATIDAIQRRYGLELPLSIPGPDGRAPKVALQPGDELFIVQASLPRLAHGEIHADETVAKAPISFLRWRVPVATVNVVPPTGIAKFAFSQIIDHAHAIALWQRGENHLQSIDVLKEKYDREVKEMLAAAKVFHEVSLDYSPAANEKFLDVYMEAADVLYYALCHWHQLVKEHPDKCEYNEPKHGEDVFWNASYLFKREAVVSLDSVIDTMLLKYARRAAGHPKDQDVERRLVAPLFPRTMDLYQKVEVK